ncbi:MAG: crotonase/enoyl-CoA hydratase family protein [Candidatus Tectomicrobia bacterium]|uniref:Crotonase/enoyl-CoA hydratase family protein n=1 Tax=Tectimicrobiota bacterium TaxID=2528274 RepID=A0A938B1Q4_UNCTE|nr:crotonase/enoyl-CoA hydratase family protein [Candidatus Tectomicrobia bacterium]
MGNYTYLLYEAIGRVARITLNRPEKLNALSVPLQEELVLAVKEAEADPRIHAVLLRGAGRAFCAGYDITPTPDRGATQATRTIRSDISRMEETVARWQALWNLRIPTIAQVHGYCVAGGTDLALHCDMIVVADEAQIGFTPVRAMGTPPTHMWLYSVGPQWAKRLLLTGDLIDGKTACEIGWAVASVPTTSLDETALKLATRMSHIGRDLLTANKYIVNKGLELMGRSLLQQLALEHDAMAHLAPEALEFTRIAQEQGLKAALEWRDGPFRA